VSALDGFPLFQDQPPVFEPSDQGVAWLKTLHTASGAGITTRPWGIEMYFDVGGESWYGENKYSQYGL